MSSPEISFENTENAFAYKSDRELRHAYWLFRVISRKSLVAAAMPLLRLAMRIRLPVMPLIRATIYRHFCGGKDIGACERTVVKLWKHKVGSILDFSVEGKEREEVFDSTAAEIVRTIERSAGDPSIPFCVFKPSGIARHALLEKAGTGGMSKEEKEEFDRVRGRFEIISRAVSDNHVRLFVDAEESWCQDAVDAIVQTLMMQANKQEALVYNTVQMYRTGRLAWMHAAWQHARTHGYKLGLKLVRGAYMEKERERASRLKYPSPIQPNKSRCDEEYDAALRFCTDHIDDISFCNGTHNEKSSMLLTCLMAEKGLSPDDQRVWFSQLLGMSDHISFNLAQAGYNVCKYVPYGPVDAVLPYLIRRAEENSAIAGQMNRELMMITRERKRRGKKWQ